MKKNKFLKTLLSSLMALSVVSTAAIPVSAEEAEAETEIGITEIAETEEEEEVIEIPEEEEDEEVEIGLGSPEEDEEETGLGFVGFEDNADEVAVTANAPEGAFPEDTEMTAETVTDPEVLDLIKNAVGENAEVLAAIDITFTSNGEPVQPDDAVKVIFASNDIAYSESLRVVHVDDKGEELKAEVLDPDALTETEDGNLAFNANSFSVYAVVDDGSTAQDARITVNFWKNADDAEPVATVYVKKADFTNTASDGQLMIEHIMFDPGVGGSLDNNQLFYGWSLDIGEIASLENLSDEEKAEYVGAAYGVDTESKTIEDIKAFLKDLATTEGKGITEGDVLDVYAMIFNVYKVIYKDNSGVTHATENVKVPANSPNAEFEIKETYTATDDTHNFEGWQTDDTANIVSAEYDGEAVTTPPYKQGTTMVIKGSITFTTNISEGYWLIYDENGYGATYNAPVFVKKNGDAYGTSPEPKREVTRNGYTLVGWYTVKDGVTLTDADKDEDGYYIISDEKFQPYTFGSQVDKKTTVYAKWNVADTATYTIIVWKQSVSDDKDAADSAKTYDYGFSTTATANSNTAVSALDLSTYKGLAGTTYNQVSFYGFKLNTTQTAKANSGNVTIGGGIVANYNKVQPNGTTVIHIFYDRELVTFNYYTPHTGGYTPNNYGGYGLVNGVYVYLGSSSSIFTTTYYYLTYSDGTPVPAGTTVYRQRNSGGWRSSEEPSYNYTWYSEQSTNSPLTWTQYSGQRYAYSNTTIYSLDESRTMTGLYGQKLSKYDYTWPTDYRWFIEIDGSTFVSVVDMFGSSYNDDAEEEFVSNFYGYAMTPNTNVYHFLQQTDGTYKEAQEDADFTIPTVIGNGMVFRSFQGFTASEFRISLPSGVTTYTTGTSYNGSNLVNPASHTTTTGWTEWLPYGTGVEYTGNSRHETDRWNVTAGGIEFRYTRNQYDLTYMVGRFVNSKNEVLIPLVTGELKKVEDITYEGSMASYAKGGDNYFDPDKTIPQTGFVFAGWYVDETCTTEATFDGTMPLNGMTVYGKWQQIEYRAFLHANALLSDGSRDQTLDWGKDDQAMNFRIAYGEKVSVPETGLRNGYDFMGWYTDASLTSGYNSETRLTNDTVPETPVYDKENDFTDGMNGTTEVAMDKWSLIPEGATPINKDVGRDWITRKLDLYAKWSAKLDGADGIQVQYDLNGGTGTVGDNNLYKDNVWAIAQAASTAPEGQQFKYWVLQKWNESTQKYDDLTGEDAIAYPGEEYKVLKANARVSDVTRDDKGNIVSATYTIQLRAEYGSPSAPTNTHINWYSNLRSVGGATLVLDKFNDVNISAAATAAGAKEGTPDASKGQLVEYLDAMQINEAIKILDADTFSYPGFRFLGWAKKPDATADELFLKYVEATSTTAAHFEAKIKDENNVEHWVTVKRVAADELEPYDDIYAIWKGQYTIRWSSDLDKVETYDVDDKHYTADTLAASVDGNHLYGGYYQYTETEGITLTEYTGEQEGYWGQSCFKVMQKSWDAITLEEGATYFVKEVPDWYLAPFFQYQYKVNYNYMTQMYLLTAVDDGYYREVGFARLNADAVGDYKYGHKTTVDGKDVYDTTTLFELLPDNKPEMYNTISFATTFELHSAKDRYTLDAPYLIERCDTTGTTHSNAKGYVVYKNMYNLKHDVPESESFYRVDHSFSDLTFNYVAFFRTPDNRVVFGKKMRNVNTGMGDVDLLDIENIDSSTYATSIGYITQQPTSDQGGN